MKRVFVGAALATTVTFGMVASAQSTPQAPPQTPATAQAPAQQPTSKAPEQQVTLVGCVQTEDDYRKAHNLAKGGAVGTGVGSGNEFVLISASISTGAGAATGATGTSGTTAEGSAFELSGTKEGDLKAFVGKRVEITGKLKAAEKSATGATTGGATAGTPPTGVDVTSQDLKLREVDIVSVKESTGTCPTPMK